MRCACTTRTAEPRCTGALVPGRRVKFLSFLPNEKHQSTDMKEKTLSLTKENPPDRPKTVQSGAERSKSVAISPQLRAASEWRFEYEGSRCLGGY